MTTTDTTKMTITNADQMVWQLLDAMNNDIDKINKREMTEAEAHEHADLWRKIGQSLAALGPDCKDTARWIEKEIKWQLKHPTAKVLPLHSQPTV